MKEKMVFQLDHYCGIRQSAGRNGVKRDEPGLMKRSLYDLHHQDTPQGPPHRIYRGAVADFYNGFTLLRVDLALGLALPSDFFCLFRVYGNCNVRKTQHPRKNMARLNGVTGSGDELPDIADLLKKAKITFGTSLQNQHDRPNSSTSPAKTAAQDRRQRPLRIAHVNSLLLPLTNPSPQRLKDIQGRTGTEGKIVKGSFIALSQDKHRDGKDDGTSEGIKLRSSPRKAVRERVDYSTCTPVHENDCGLHSDSSSQDHLSDFIVDDSSDLETPPLRSPSKYTNRIQRRDNSGLTAFRPHEPSPIVDLTFPEKPSTVDSRPQTPPSDAFNRRSDEDTLGHLRL